MLWWPSERLLAPCPSVDTSPQDGDGAWGFGKRCPGTLGLQTHSGAGRKGWQQHALVSRDPVSPLFLFRFGSGFACLDDPIQGTPVVPWGRGTWPPASSVPKIPSLFFYFFCNFLDTSRRAPKQSFCFRLLALISVPAAPARGREVKSFPPGGMLVLAGRLGGRVSINPLRGCGERALGLAERCWSKPNVSAAPAALPASGPAEKTARD